MRAWLTLPVFILASILPLSVYVAITITDAIYGRGWLGVTVSELLTPWQWIGLLSCLVCCLVGYVIGRCDEAEILHDEAER